jgi:hypothetical protein
VAGCIEYQVNVLVFRPRRKIFASCRLLPRLCSEWRKKESVCVPGFCFGSGPCIHRLLDSLKVQSQRLSPVPEAKPSSGSRPSQGRDQPRSHAVTGLRPTPKASCHGAEARARGQPSWGRGQRQKPASMGPRPAPEASCHGAKASTRRIM